jgi:hypothetical protein
MLALNSWRMPILDRKCCHNRFDRICPCNVCFGQVQPQPRLVHSRSECNWVPQHTIFMLSISASAQTILVWKRLVEVRNVILEYVECFFVWEWNNLSQWKQSCSSCWPPQRYSGIHGGHEYRFQWDSTCRSRLLRRPLLVTLATVKYDGTSERFFKRSVMVTNNIETMHELSLEDLVWTLFFNVRMLFHTRKLFHQVVSLGEEVL